MNEVTKNEWNHEYSRTAAAYPVKEILNNKFWPNVGRVNNAFGDRNLICCIPVSDFIEEEVK
jgi:glycine dehydrogenase